MRKLTKAQAEVLQEADEIFYRPITNRAFYVAKGGFAIKVHIATFNALTLRDFYRCEGGTGAAKLYRRTDAGRRALQEGRDG
jgi:hypothetical protein